MASFIAPIASILTAGATSLAKPLIDDVKNEIVELTKDAVIGAIKNKDYSRKLTIDNHRKTTVGCNCRRSNSSRVGR